MKELLDLIKAVAIIYGLVFYCTSGMKCNRSSEAYKREIIQDYLEDEGATIEDVVDGDDDKDGQTIAAVDVSSSLLKQNTSQKADVSGDNFSFTTVFFCLMLATLFYFGFVKKYDNEEEEIEEPKEKKHKIYFTTDSHTPYTKHIEVEEDGKEVPVWDIQNEHQKSKSRAKLGRTTSLTNEDRNQIKKRWKSKKIPMAQISLCKGYWAAGNSNRAINKLMPDFSQTYINLACACFSSALSASNGDALNARQNGSKGGSKSAFTVVLDLFK